MIVNCKCYKVHHYYVQGVQGDVKKNLLRQIGTSWVLHRLNSTSMNLLITNSTNANFIPTSLKIILVEFVLVGDPLHMKSWTWQFLVSYYCAVTLSNYLLLYLLLGTPICYWKDENENYFKVSKAVENQDCDLISHQVEKWKFNKLILEVSKV